MLEVLSAKFAWHNYENKSQAEYKSTKYKKFLFEFKYDLENVPFKGIVQLFGKYTSLLLSCLYSTGRSKLPKNYVLIFVLKTYTVRSNCSNINFCTVSMTPCPRVIDRMFLCWIIPRPAWPGVTFHVQLMKATLCDSRCAVDSVCTRQTAVIVLLFFPQSNITFHIRISVFYYLNIYSTWQQHTLAALVW